MIAPLPLLLHKLAGVLGADHVADQVDLDHLPPLADRKLGELVGLEYPRVRDEHVQPAEVALDALHRGVDLEVVGHVHPHALRLDAVLARDLLGGRLGAVLVDVGDDHDQRPRSRTARNRLAQPLRRRP